MPESEPDAQTKPQLIHVAGSTQTNVAQHERLVSLIDDDVWVGESLTELLESHGLDTSAYASAPISSPMGATGSPGASSSTSTCRE